MSCLKGFDKKRPEITYTAYVSVCQIPAPLTKQMTKELRSSSKNNTAILKPTGFLKWSRDGKPVSPKTQATCIS
jgi:hypothetical protein